MLLSCRDLRETTLVQEPDFRFKAPSEETKRYDGKLVKTKYLSWLSHTRKICFPFLGFVAGGAEGPVMGGAGTQSQRAAAVLILGLASKHTADWLGIRLLLLALPTHWNWHFSYMIILWCPYFLSLLFPFFLLFLAPLPFPFYLIFCILPYIRVVIFGHPLALFSSFLSQELSIISFVMFVSKCSCVEKKLFMLYDSFFFLTY